MLNGGIRTKGITKKSQNNKPLITVITVVYNGEKTLEETIKSVINQTYDNIEYIIIDGNSSDGTLDIIKKYEDKIDYWQSEPDKGIYDAMNKGIELAQRDYVALLNADDWYEPDTCLTIANEILKNKADVYHGVLRFVNKNGDVLKIEGYTINLLAHGMIAHPTCFISRDIYKTVKYNINYKSAADYDLINYLAHKNIKFYFIPKILANFREGGMSSNIIGLVESAKIQRKYKYISVFNYLIKMVYYRFNILMGALLK